MPARALTHIELPKPHTSEELGLTFWLQTTGGKDYTLSALNSRDPHTTNYTPHWCPTHLWACSAPCYLCPDQDVEPPAHNMTPAHMGWVPQPTRSKPMAAKKRRSKKRSNGASTPDRAGMISEKLTKAEVDKRGRTLAKEERKLLKAKAKKKSTVTVMNEEIRGLEAGIDELSEQVDTGCHWVKAQLPIPGA